MDPINELKISEIKKTISLLKWDLSILRNKETKAKKEAQLRLYKQKLAQIIAHKNNAAS